MKGIPIKVFPFKFSLAVAGSSGQKEEFWLLKKPRGSNDDDEDDENDDNDDVDIVIMMMMMMMHQVHSPTNCWDQKKFSSCIGKPLRPFYSNKKPSQPRKIKKNCFWPEIMPPKFCLETFAFFVMPPKSDLEKK